MRSFGNRWRAELGWVVSGHATAAVGLLVTIRFLTSRLAPHEYGKVAIALTLSILISQLVAGPLTSSFVRYFSPAAEGAEFPAYLAALGVLAKRLVTVFAAVGGVLLIFGATVQSEFVRLAAPTVFFAVLSGSEQALDGIQNAARHRALVAWHLAFGSWAKLALSAIVFEIFSASSGSVLWAFTASSALVLISQVAFFRRRIMSYPSAQNLSTEQVRAWLSRMLTFSGPFVVWGLAQWALLASDRYALGVFEDATAVGLYNVVYQIGYYPITILSAVALQLTVPVLYGIAGDASDPDRLGHARHLTRQLSLAAAVLSMIGAVVAALAHGYIFDLLVGESYRDASRYLPFVLVAAGLFAAGQIAAQAPLLALNARGLLWPKLVTAAAGILGNILGAYFYGIQGVVAAGVLFSVVYFSWMFFLPNTPAAISASPRPDVEPVSQQFI